MEIISAITKRGLELRGAMFGNSSMDTVVVMATGICSNVFQNDLLAAAGKLLEKNNIATIIAHAHDSFSCLAYSDHSTGKQKHAGVFNDDFSMVYEDIESYVIKAHEMGFKKIILAGHSLGSNKIIHYLANTKDDFIDNFIVSSPIDIMHWWKVMPNIDENFELAKKWVEEGKGDYILPKLFGGFSPMCAKSVLGFYNAENLKNCPVLSNCGETESLYNIKQSGLFLIGSKDSVTGKSPKAFMEQLNNWTKDPSKNKVVEIAGASHIFYNMHDKYAEAILEYVESVRN